MPSNSDRPFDHDTMKLRAVFVHKDDKDQISQAGIVGALGYDTVKIPAVFVPKGGTPPGYPYEHFGRAEFRRSGGDGGKRIFNSGPSAAGPQDAKVEDGESGPTLPRTRYRFGSALSDGRSPGVPPNPAGGQRDPVAAGIAVWRGMANPGNTLRRSLAAPSPAGNLTTAAGSGTEDAPAEQVGPLSPNPFDQAAGSMVYTYVSNDPLNRTDPSGLFANVGTGGTAGLQGKGGSGSIVQAGAAGPDPSSEIEPNPNSPQTQQPQEPQPESPLAPTVDPRTGDSTTRGIGRRKRHTGAATYGLDATCR